MPTGNDWTKYDSGTCRKPSKSLHSGRGSLVLSLADLHSLVQCWPSANLLHTPEDWWLLFGLPVPVSRNALHTVLFKWPYLPQLKHVIFIFLKTFKSYFPIRVASQTSIDVAFENLITFLYFELAFSKAKDSINICKHTIMFTAEVSICKKISEGFFLDLSNFSKWLRWLSWFSNPVWSSQSC